MRVLYPKSRQNHFARVRTAVPIRVTHPYQIMTMLDITPVPMRQNSQRNGQTVRKNHRLFGITRRFPVGAAVNDIVN